MVQYRQDTDGYCAAGCSNDDWGIDMVKPVNKKALFFAMGIILMLQIIAVFWFCSKKSGFHYDEYYSYYSSNVTLGLVPTDREWKSQDEIRNEFAVLDGQQFRFKDVVRMQTYDVHPPLYYLLLHAICSLTPGVFSKWSGLALNLILFVISWCILAALTFEMVRAALDEEAGRLSAAAVCLLYGFNPAVISGIMLVRMYMLLGAFVLFATWLHVRALYRNRRGRSFYLPLMITVYLGFLTHYYFAVFLFFLAAAMEFYLLFETVENKSWGQKWKDCFVYGAVVVGAMAAAVLSYPACLGHIFRGYRGTEAMGEFFNAGNTPGRIRFFAGLLNEYVFGGMLPAVVLVFLLLSMTAWMLAKLRHRGKGSGRAMRYRAVWIPAAAVAGYFAVVTKTALLTAEEANRYQLPVYGLILMFTAVAAVLLLNRIAALGRAGAKWGSVRPARVAGGLLLFVLLAGEIKGLTQNRVLFLYQEDAANIAFAEENHDVPVVYFYNGNLMWMIWDDSLELMQYDQIYFVNMADVSPLADERLAGAKKVFVYVARGENADRAPEAVKGGADCEIRKVRELLYCDLYEVTEKSISVNEQR